MVTRRKQRGRPRQRSYLERLTALSCLVLLPLLSFAGPEDPEEGGAWGPVISWPHIAVSAANLPDGRVLTWSGSERETWPSTEQTYSATFDPQTNEFIEIFHPAHNMFCAHLAMLEDGRVFVNGGRNQTNSPWTSIFDFRQDKWVQVENMATGGRWYPTTVALDNGDVLTAIGTATNQQYPETWNIDDGWQIKNGIDFNTMVLDSYYSSGTHGESRWWPLLHVAPNGQVFHSGPTPRMHYIDPDGNGSYQYANVEFTDFYHKHGTTIMYDEGKILTAGGWVSGNNIASTNQAFTIDINGPSPIVTPTQPMTHKRKFHNGIILPTGEVLVIGGNTSGQKFSDNGAILATEIWDPAAGVNGEWRLGASMAVPRNYHSVGLLLTDGRVLAAGSGYCSGSVTCNGSSHKDGEIYSPPYLFDSNGNLAARPSISNAPGQISSGQVFSVSADPGIARFTMIKMGSTTHGVNTDVRFLNVDFTEISSGNYNLTANGNQSVMTPGYWMIFALDSNGVPSEAQVVLANSSGMPWIAAISNQNTQVDDSVSFQVVAGDADNDALVYNALGLPPGLQIDPVSGLISGTVGTEGNYQVTVSVTDNDEGIKERSFAWTIFGQGLGTIRRDWWTGISGSAVNDLTSNGNFPDSPTGTDFLTSFEAPTNWADNYGTRVHGFVTPSETGNYIFAIATDDGGELWLSSDSNPSNKMLIADVPGWAGPRNWTKYTEQQSAPIALQAGETYYIEALQKEGGGADNLAVAWQTPSSGSLDVIPGAFLSSSNISIEPTAEAKLFAGRVDGIGDAWATVNLPLSYDDMVVVATAQYTAADLPVVTRVRGAVGNQFEVRVQNPGDGAISPTYSVHFVVAEVGVFEDSGIRLEVAKFQSTVVDENGSWVGEPREYQHSYSSPVAVGQVMTDNDPRWSVFWASDGTAANPPSASSISVGRHVGEDSDTTRASETIGYIVVDAGSGLIGDVPFEAMTGTASIAGVGDSPPYSYSLIGQADFAVLSSAGMNGSNGGWPIFYGTDPLAAVQISHAIDEDQISDSERGHAAEQVAYMAFADSPLVVNPVITSPEVTGEDVTFSVTASGGSGLLYNWNFGDGGGDTGFDTMSEMTHAYSSPGRYVVTVTVRDPITGEEVIETFIQIIHWPLTSELPSHSTSIALHEAFNQVWNVNPDNDSVSVLDTVTLNSVIELPAGSQPVSLAIAPNGNVWVVNRKSASVSIFDPATLMLTMTLQLPQRSQPDGLAFDDNGGFAYVVLEATGDLLKIDASTGALINSVYVGKAPRNVSVNWDGSVVLVSHFITPPLPNESTIPIVESGGVYYGGEVSVIDPVSMSVSSTVTLRHSDRLVSEHSGPGVPNYLGPVTISPDGRSAWVPSKQDNILAGGYRGGQGMTFDQTVRAITSKIDMLGLAEDFPMRVDHDNASVGTYSAFGPHGVYLFTALEGNREVAVSDAFTGTEIHRFDVGRAPQGLAVSDSGTTLYVHNFMDRTVGIYDISEINVNNEMSVSEIATIDTVQAESLTPTVLLGKQLFYDSRDPRLALDSYMSCASCHNDGGHDGRVWDITTLDEGISEHEGVRNTISLQGRAAMVHGFLHWTANFDEVQDFEGQIRTLSGGTGLMDDADFFAGTTSEPLGDPKAGKSADLDALSAYLGSLDEFADSPYRNNDGTLTAVAELGRAVFEAKNCASCHAPDRYTDSGDTVLHDIGTITPASGKRLGGPLTGFDTPTLISVWNTAPYLHDGSAFDITEAVSAHTGISLTVDELNQLGAYLEQLDSVTAGISVGCPDCIDFSVVTTSSFADQDADSAFTVLNGGLAIRLDGNTWRQTDTTYTITPNTRLEFTFESSDEGEVHGIGFDYDQVDLTNPHSANRIFRVYGTQNWGIPDFNTYTGPGPETFVIPVGQYYTGSGFYLVIANDDDAGGGANGTFSNVRLYEDIPPPVAPVIDDPGDQVGRIGTPVQLTMTATDANGDPLTFDATGLPDGLGIAPNGVISGTPTTLGTWSPVTVTVDDGAGGSDFVNFDWTIEEAAACTDCVDLLTSTTSSFDTQDADSDFTILNGGTAIRLDNNTWRQTDETYTITPDTVIEFTFESTVEGEVHGIGFDEDNKLSANRIFRIYGTQNWGINDFNTYTGPGPETFVIPVGEYYTGSGFHLVIANDDDAGVGANGTFSDIRIYEDVPLPAAPVIDNPGDQISHIGTNVSLTITATDVNGDPLTFSATGLPDGLVIATDGEISGIPTTIGTWSPVTITVDDGDSGTANDQAIFDWTITDPPACVDCIDFVAVTTSSFADQDQHSNVMILDAGATLRLDNNTWRQTDTTYTITPNTVIEFTFESSVEGEVHGIGFDINRPNLLNSVTKTRIFRLHGTQNWGNTAFNTYTGSGPQVFTIPVGQYYTGSGLHLIFADDDDAGVGANSSFSNVRIYESAP